MGFYTAGKQVGFVLCSQVTQLWRWPKNREINFTQRKESLDFFIILWHLRFTSIDIFYYVF